MGEVGMLSFQNAKSAEPHTQERMNFNVEEDLPLTSGGVIKYKDLLGADVRGLQGKTVLDAGSGCGAFVDDCNNKGVDVIGMDPHYMNIPLRKEKGKEIPKSTKNKMAGVCETLPFKDKVFDLVLSCYASFYYLLNNYEDDVKVRRIAAKLMFEEAFRVLKVGGQARIGEECCETEEDILFFKEVLTDISKTNPALDWSFSNSEMIPDVLILRRLK